MKHSAFVRLAFVATCLTLFVVVLGAYVRLSDAGLGCPDWPGCYGHLDVPKKHDEVHAANQAFPERLVETHKAWKEMIHRYFAGILLLLVFTLAVMAWRKRHEEGQQVFIPMLLVGVISFQAILGMWTVTLLLKPLVVMAHLMGGMTTLALLWWITLRHSRVWQGEMISPEIQHRFKQFALIGLVIVVLQIMLGGWTSANYAALHCPDLPTCQGQWLPPMDFKDAFTLWRGLGVNYEYGVLDNDARVTIHVMHRIGAVITLMYIGALAFVLWRFSKSQALKRVAIAMLVILLIQFSLGIANVIFSLPLLVADAHNGFGALLLLSLVTVNHVVRKVNKN